MDRAVETEVRLGPDHRPLRGHGPRCRVHLVGSCRLADGAGAMLGIE